MSRALHLVQYLAPEAAALSGRVVRAGICSRRTSAAVHTVIAVFLGGCSTFPEPTTGGAPDPYAEQGADGVGGGQLEGHANAVVSVEGDFPKVIFDEIQRTPSGTIRLRKAVAGKGDAGNAARVMPTLQDLGDGDAMVERATSSARVEDEDAAMPSGEEIATQRQVDRHSSQGGPSPLDLIEEIRARGDSEMARALDIATLRALGPATKLDVADLSGLDTTATSDVHLYHDLLVALRERLLGGDSIDRQWADGLLQQDGDLPVKIKTMLLCTRVQGYGDYETLAGRRFMAGTKPSFVLYAELARFRIQPLDDGVNEVRLSQELTLYTETGTTVWRHPPVMIVDASRNRRRDFFTTQVVRIPPSLGVGKYLLSLTVTDRHGDSMDEQKVSIEVVASSSLVRQEQ